ncbi:MAG: NUDIX domain-containing protein, partial [Sutterellaceae bacterium]|nr:NUDIX domain-containing protein [Sutterellaceae bacterium]
LIAAGETPATSLFRELEEEAGLTESDVVLDKTTAQFTVTRVVPEGWMHEVAFVYPCTVKDDTRVHNVDGEVSRFTLFSQDELLEKIRGHMTPADTAVAFLKTIELKN